MWWQFNCGLVVFLGVVISISSYSWFGFWLGMEISFFSVVPLLHSDFNVMSKVGPDECIIKYFLVQSVGSIIVLLGVVIMSGGVGYVAIYLVLGGLFMKLGLFPFYLWVPKVIGGLTWGGCFMVGCVQNIGPVVFLADIIISFGCVLKLVGYTATVTGLVGVFGGLSQVLLRSLLSYSSINHVGWVCCIMSFDVEGGYLYFLFYFFIGGFLFLLLSLYDINSCVYINFSENSSPGFIVLVLSVSLLSLGGVPPFSGFFVKLLGFVTMVSYVIFIVVYIISSLLSLLYYLGVVIVITVSLSYFKGVRWFYWGGQYWFKVLVLTLNFLGPFFYGFVMLL